ncbi:HIT family protein [Lactobacillus selangorensis]|uniref:HIT family protein n=1 Tax=Lactobacillus selangorensis TaxID=81857 RepID=A0A0R2FWU4_9LACO|nr:HIT family protein [Lactobacillus selangorensis]KRN29754.1 HIT family protein [Lactobacillus selangorensis]KRN33717.1 HIT family protein [Lactobacillus selangorensis]
MQDCVFCKIVAGEIPSTTVYEDDVVKAFLDLTQTTPGHTLVVPKKHVPDIFAYDADLAGEVFKRIPMIARAIKASNPAIKGMNIINNNGEIAYQSVFHSHFHLIPRYSEADDFSIHFGDHSDDYSQADLQKIADDIHAQLEASK